MSLNEIIRNAVTGAMDRAKGNQRAAARELNISRWSLARLLKKYGLRGLDENAGEKAPGA